MERHEIETFLVLAEELHFGRSGERLRVSTARVSQTIRRLERRIGAPLFERTSRRVALTPIGAQFRDDLEPAYRRIGAALSNAIAAGRDVNGVVRVGFLGPTAGDLLLTVLGTFRRSHRDSEIQLRETTLDDLFGPLRRGDIDLLLTKFPVCEPDLSTGSVLLREPRMLAVSSRHRLARRESACMEDLADDVLVDVAGVPDYWRQVHLPGRTPGGRPITRGPAVATLHELLLMVAAGRGVCCVDASVARLHARPDIAYIPLRDAPPFESGLVWRPAAETALTGAFIRVAHDLVRRSASGRAPRSRPVQPAPGAP